VAQKIQIEMERIGLWWCNLMHDAPRWPIHGKYECGACGRHYPVLWEQQTILAANDWSVVAEPPR
jgi:hypothetical protein